MGGRLQVFMTFVPVTAAAMHTYESHGGSRFKVPRGVWSQWWEHSDQDGLTFPAGRSVCSWLLVRLDSKLWTAATSNHLQMFPYMLPLAEIQHSIGLQVRQPHD